MKTAFLLLVVLVTAVPALAAGDAGFPLVVGKTTIQVTPASGRPDLAAALAAALPGETPSISTPERLQYDYQAAPDVAPLTLALDYDAKGRLAGVIIDAMQRDQNPVAVSLAAWLAAQAGPGVTQGDDTVWTHAGFVFTLTVVRDDGEDSMYAMVATPKGR